MYRKWDNPEGEYNAHYLRIEPSGAMREIAFGTDRIGARKASVLSVGPLNPINDQVFKKHKEVCSRAEWDKAVKAVIDLMKPKKN